MSQACPGATLWGYSIWAIDFFKNSVSNSKFAMPGLGQGHNQKKDTHTLDFDVTLTVHLTDNSQGITKHRASPHSPWNYICYGLVLQVIMNPSPNTVRVNLSALKHNLLKVREFVGKRSGIMGMVKSDGYGHGLVQIAREYILWKRG